LVKGLFAKKTSRFPLAKTAGIPERAGAESHRLFFVSFNILFVSFNIRVKTAEVVQAW
jgi:hypothetical protein